MLSVEVKDQRSEVKGQRSEVKVMIGDVISYLALKSTRTKKEDIYKSLCALVTFHKCSPLTKPCSFSDEGTNYILAW